MNTSLVNDGSVDKAHAMYVRYVFKIVELYRTKIKGVQQDGRLTNYEPL